MSNERKSKKTIRRNCGSRRKETENIRASNCRHSNAIFNLNPQVTKQNPIYLFHCNPTEQTRQWQERSLKSAKTHGGEQNFNASS